MRGGWRGAYVHVGFSPAKNSRFVLFVFVCLFALPVPVRGEKCFLGNIMQGRYGEGGGEGVGGLWVVGCGLVRTLETRRRRVR